MNDEKAILWRETLVHLDEGNFTALEIMLGGPDGFDRQIVEWFGADKFADQPEMLAEVLSCACLLGRTATARYLIDAGVDPYAGMKTWLAGPHYAVSGGHLDTVKMLIERQLPLEIKNGYGGTMLGQALWSAVNEHKDTHAEIIEILIGAGAMIEHGTLEWWKSQRVPSDITRQRVLELLTSKEAR